MSFEKSMPGKSGIAKSAIKTVTANRNPNRQIVVGKTPEEESKDKEEKDSDLRSRFDQVIAQEFSQGKNSFQQFQQRNQQNQMAQLAAMQQAGAGAGMPQIQMPKIPSGGGASSGSSKNSGSSQSKPQNQNITKPNLVDDSKNKPQVQKPDTPKINPLSKPGQTNNNDKEVEKSRSATNQEQNSNPKLAQAVASDANRISELRGFENPEQSRALSQTMLNGYTQNSDKHSLSDAGVRRLVNHNIPFNPSLFNPQNTAKQNDELSNKLISTRNETALAKLHEGPKLAEHYKSLGFKRGDYSQQTAKQFKESFNYIQEVKNNPSSRSEKQALILLPEKGAAQFDMVNEVEDLKKLGFTPVFAQIDSEKGLHTKNEDGSKTPIKKLADDLGGFDLVVLGGHGQNSKTPGIKFGEESKITDPKNSTQIAKAEKSFLDRTDFKDDKGVVDFFKDRSILKEGGTLASCSCSFTGSSEDRGKDHIKPEESLASIIEGIRPDADVLGAFDEVYASDSKYSLDEDGKLQNPTMRRLDEPEVTEESLQLVASNQEQTKEDTALDMLDDIFAEDYADDIDDILAS